VDLKRFLIEPRQIPMIRKSHRFFLHTSLTQYCQGQDVLALSNNSTSKLVWSR